MEQDFTWEEKAILKFVSIYPEFTLSEFCKDHQKMYGELKGIKKPEKVLKELVRKKMAKIKTKNNAASGEEIYQFIYGISMSFKDGKEEIYDVEEAKAEAMRLRYEICP